MEHVELNIGNRLIPDKRLAAQEIMQKQYELNPSLLENYSKAEKAVALRDTIFNLEYLCQALELDFPDFFKHYVYWLRSVLISRNVPESGLKTNLKMIKEYLYEKYEEEEASKKAAEYIDSTLEVFGTNIESKSVLEKNLPYFEEAKEYLKILQNNNRKQAINYILQLYQEKKRSIRDIYIHILQPVQYEVGRLWETNQISVAQEHYMTAVSQLAISQLYPYIFNTARCGKSMVATCIGGELHEMGIRMISDLFELEGWDTYYLGANTPAESIIDTIISNKADLLAISATMMSNVQEVRNLIQEIRKSSTSSIKILVGGYPFNLDKSLWKKIGADGYASDANDAIKKANSLIS